MKKNTVSLVRMDGTRQVWELVAKPVTSILSAAAGLNGSRADAATARACRAGLLEVYGSPDRALKALGDKPAAAKIRLQDAGTVKQLLVDALDLHPALDLTDIGPFHRVQ